MYYYLSLGSNIAPRENMANIIAGLLQAFGCVTVFPVQRTVPDALTTERQFFNTLAIIYSDKDAMAVKQYFNALEERLGRDRSDPQRSTKDRTADIDILASSERLDPNVFARFPDSYVQQVFSLQGPFETVPLGGISTGDRPATIYLDRATGQERILNDKLDGLTDWLESRLEGE